MVATVLLLVIRRIFHQSQAFSSCTRALCNRFVATLRPAFDSRASNSALPRSLPSPLPFGRNPPSSEWMEEARQVGPEYPRISGLGSAPAESRTPSFGLTAWRSPSATLSRPARDSTAQSQEHWERPGLPAHSLA